MGLGGTEGSGGPGGLEALEITDIRSPLSQAVLQETRLRIIAVLASTESRRRAGYSLQELGQILDCSPQNAHHHLKILERVGAVRVARTEATQRIPRQFWVSDILHIRLRPMDQGVLDLDLSLPEETHRRLSKDLRKWAEVNGGDEAHRVALELGAYVASLPPRRAELLLEILERHRSRA